MGTSLNAFINVQLRIYFLALYVNLIELCSDFLYISYTLMNSFKSKTKKDKKKKTAAMIDQAGWSLMVET